MKEFISTARAKSKDAQGLPDLDFKLDGNVYVLRAPDEDAFAVLIAQTTARRTSDADRVTAILDFFEDSIAAPGGQLLINRLLDRDDDFGFEQIRDIMEWAVAEWSGRPSTSSAASSRSRSTNGRRSTAGALPAGSSR